MQQYNTKLADSLTRQILLPSNKNNLYISLHGIVMYVSIFGTKHRKKALARYIVISQFLLPCTSFISSVV